MGQELNYYFAPTGGGEDTGYNDPTASIFKGNIYEPLARESLQNIIDAHDPKINQPVIAEFKLFEIRSQELPKYDRLRQIFHMCREYITSPDGKSFFNSAISDIVEDKRIPILKISDYNTRGLSGDENTTSSDYYSLLESSGSSSKGGDRAGSFGLGKGAFSAASNFRTVFFSSVYENTNVVFKGKLRLTSFKEGGERMQGVGSFSLPGQKPVREKELIPELFRRDKNGLDVYIVNFKKEPDWKEQIIKKIINDFWLAILNERLIVKIEDIEINKENIGKTMRDFFSNCEPDIEGAPNPIPYYDAYTSPKKQVIEKDLDVIGKCKLYLLFNGNANQAPRVSHYRSTGMLIQKKPYRTAQTYSGVFVCLDNEGNNILRKMENPQHNSWKADNAIGTELSPETARKAEKAIKDFIIKSIDDHSKPLEEDSLEIADLEQYLFLPDFENEDYKFFENKGAEEVNKEGQPIDIGRKINKAMDEFLEITRKPVSLTIKNTSEGVHATENIDGRIPGDGGKGSGGGIGQPGEEVIGGDMPLTNDVPLKFRSFAVKEIDDKFSHVIILESSSRSNDFNKIDLRVLAGTDDSYDELEISHAHDDSSAYRVEKNIIKDVLIKHRTRLKINFLERGRFALRVEAYEAK